jgi:hypothetical protein
MLRCPGRPSHRILTVVQSLVHRLAPLGLRLWVGLLMAACATLAKDCPRTPSSALSDHAGTEIGRDFDEAAICHPGKSRFTLLRFVRPAFTARIALTDLAQKTPDLKSGWKRGGLRLSDRDAITRAS